MKFFKNYLWLMIFACYGSSVLSMESDEINHEAQYEDLESQGLRLLKAVHDLNIQFGGVALIFDTSDQQTILKNGHEFTYYIPGFADVDFTSTFSAYREKRSFQFPGSYVVVNGASNGGNKFFNAFSLQNEAKRHLPVIADLFKRGFPVKTIHTHCYGFWGFASLLYALASDAEEAKQIRRECEINDELAKYIINEIKLVIIQSPFTGLERVIEHRFAEPTAHFSERVLSGLITGSAIYWTVHNKGSSLIGPLGLVLPLGIRMFGEAIYQPLIEAAKSSMVGAMPRFFKDIDKTNCSPMDIFRELATKDKFDKFRFTIFVTWQKEDPQVTTVTPEDLEELNKIGEVIGVGSPFTNHFSDDIRQKACVNQKRAKEGLAYYDDERFLEFGGVFIDSIYKNGFYGDWKFIKKYCENKSSYNNDVEVWKLNSYIREVPQPSNSKFWNSK